VANRDYTTKRSSVINGFVSHLEKVDGTGKFKSAIAEVSPRIKFWDEVTEFPAVHVSAGAETRQYLGGGEKFRFLTLTFRCYVNEEDSVTALEKLLEDVETVIEDENPLTYTDPLGKTVSTIQHSVISIDTDEGVLDPLGIGEIIAEVQY
jgi:hypothetical protein|tara:strand:- start:125 stop:574 length:450 start_codon:yes stop_codon:yes gene_type:complete